MNRDEMRDDEGPCTDCYDTGLTIQTERPCACEAGDQYRHNPAPDGTPAVDRLVEALEAIIEATKYVDGYAKDANNIARKALSAYREGRG